MAIGLIVLVFIVVLAWLPGLWVKGVLSRHGRQRADIGKTGGAFARETLDRLGLGHVGVEATREGDHYDPAAKVIRLSPAHFDRRSLAATVVAAHEIGHAMQDATDYRPLKERTRLATMAGKIERVASVILLAAPVLLIVVKSPLALVASVAAGAAVIGASVLLHALTLPVEFDASFRRALPLLKEGRLIDEDDMPAAREILRAAAFTYVAAAAMTLLDVARWFRVLRF